MVLCRVVMHIGIPRVSSIFLLSSFSYSTDTMITCLEWHQELRVASYLVGPPFHTMLGVSSRDLKLLN